LKTGGKNGRFETEIVKEDWEKNDEYRTETPKRDAWRAKQ
jgi:hypothetical protein